MRYRYLKDPLFVACVIVYAVNRFVVKPWFPNTFSQAYLNDLICIPFCVPVVVYLMRKFGWRPHDLPPSGLEIIIPLLAWSFVFEVLLQRLGVFPALATADHVDILFYCAGACLAAAYWRVCCRVAARGLERATERNGRFDRGPEMTVGGASASLSPPS